MFSPPGYSFMKIDKTTGFALQWPAPQFCGLSPCAGLYFLERLKQTSTGAWMRVFKVIIAIVVRSAICKLAVGNKSAIKNQKSAIL